MGTSYSITESFGSNLAEILANKILLVHKNFDKQEFVTCTEIECINKTYTQRVDLLATLLKRFLPEDYKVACKILMQILGEENPNETGMFTNYYWIMPIGKFVEKYGLANFATSTKAIAEITKRNTGEYAIRPFIRKFPDKSLKVMMAWAKSPNFHLRRLSSEGLRPKLPWATLLIEFVENPKPVFEILELLKEDDSKFVKKSVANHLTDYLKVNPVEAKKILNRWKKSKNPNTIWIVKHATRKINL